MATTLAARPVSDKQRSLIEKLLAERNLEGTAYEGWTPDWSKATSKAASGVISYLLNLPKRPAWTPEAGIYRHDGDLVRVYFGQKTSRMLAKRIVLSAEGPAGMAPGHVDYEFAGLARNVVTPAWTRLSVDEVGALGKSWDHCLMCGRRLDDPESVDRGIGPVCANKY